MRIAISNIAWDVFEDESVAKLLNDQGIDAIDVAPGKYFPDPEAATEHEITKVRTWWRDGGIQITGMQALLFGTTGLNMFGDQGVKAAMLKRLTGVCRIAAGLGAKNLVFGSPKNRDRSRLSDEETMQTAVEFFRQLGARAKDLGVTICLEPNPQQYGANFMMTTRETAQVVQLVDHANIRMQLDTGAMTINKEDAAEILSTYSSMVGHIHASEPDLVTLGDGGTNHAEIGKIVPKYLPNHVVCIEMVASKTEPHLKAIERSLKLAINSYRGTPVE